MSSNAPLILANRHAAEQAHAELESVERQRDLLTANINTIVTAKSNLRHARQALRVATIAHPLDRIREEIDGASDGLALLLNDLHPERDGLVQRMIELAGALERWDADRERDLVEREM